MTILEQKYLGLMANFLTNQGQSLARLQALAGRVSLKYLTNKLLLIISGNMSNLQPTKGYK